MHENRAQIEPSMLTQEQASEPIVEDVIGDIDVVNVAEVEKPKRQGVSDTVRGYTETKTGKNNAELEKEMQERAVSVARNGGKIVKREIETIFPNDIVAEAIQQPERSGEYAQVLIQEQMKILEGQSEKVDRMVQFVTQMNEWSNELITEFVATESTRTDITAEEVAANIKQYQNEIQQQVVESTRSITYQDIRASAITLGDHGWMHLTQDLRDSYRIASLKRGEDLHSREKFMLGIASAFHDIGYAVPEVSDPQRSSKGKYSTFDKGHPINSYVYLVAQKNKYITILGQEAADALFQIVANHESPEKAERAGKYSEIAEAFALADASAAFGQDKLPPIIVQIPEVLSYLNAVNMGSSVDKFRFIYDQINEEITIEEALELFQTEVVQKLKDVVVDRIDEKIQHKSPSGADSKTALMYQSDALKNTIDHFSPLSLSFLLGRMSAEAAPLQVNPNKKVQFTINAGFARELDVPDEDEANKDSTEHTVARGIIKNSIQESAVLTVKLFLELSALNISDKSVVKALVNCVAKNEVPSIDLEEKLQELGINLDVVDSSADEPNVSRSVRIESEKIVVVSKTDEGISEQNTAFYNDVSQKLDVANQEVGRFIKRHKN